MATEFHDRRILIIGLGNPIVSDDSVGLRVAALLETQLAARTDVDVTVDYWGGLRLMENMVDYDRAIVVDAIQSGAAPGTLHHLRVDSMPTQKSASVHDVNLGTALAFGRRAGLHLPADDGIFLLGIEAQDVINFSENLSPAVEAVLPDAVEVVLQVLAEMSIERLSHDLT